MASEDGNLANELLREHTLWDVYRVSWKLGVPWRLVVPSTLLWLLMLVYGFSDGLSASNLALQFRALLDLGISVVTQILGFLIAGFTIFATLTDTKLLVKMASITHLQSKLSSLKFTFSIFMHTFAHYAWFLIAAMLLRTLTPPGGVISHAINLPYWDLLEWKRAVAALALATLASWLLYLALLIQGFIFNIYHVCMFSIAVAGEKLLDE